MSPVYDNRRVENGKDSFQIIDPVTTNPTAIEAEWSAAMPKVLPARVPEINQTNLKPYDDLTGPI